MKILNFFSYFTKSGSTQILKRTVKLRNVRTLSVFNIQQPRVLQMSSGTAKGKHSAPNYHRYVSTTNIHEKEYKQPTERSKLKEKVTYQSDVTSENIDEIIEAFQSVKDIAYILDVINENVLRACTVFSDAPWWTARNEEGKLLGWMVVSTIGEKHAKGGFLCTLPEYRGTELPFKLYRSAVNYIRYENTSSARNFWCAAYPHALALVKTLIPDLHVMDRFICGSMGKPKKYHDNLFPKSSNGIDIVPFSSKGQLYDKLVEWDADKIHDKFPRRSFLDVFLAPPIMTAYVAVSTSSGDVVGYGGIQDTFNPDNQVLSPLYAEDDNIAMVLLHHVMKHYRGNKISIMYFDDPPVMDLVARMGLGVDAKIQCFASEYPYPLQEHLKYKYFTVNGLNVMF